MGGGHLVKMGQNNDFLKKVPKNDFEGHKSGSPVFGGVQHPFLGLRGPLIEPSISAREKGKKGKREKRRKREKEKKKKGTKGKRGKREKEKKGKREKEKKG